MDFVGGLGAKRVRFAAFPTVWLVSPTDYPTPSRPNKIARRATGNVKKIL